MRCIVRLSGTPFALGACFACANVIDCHIGYAFVIVIVTFARIKVVTSGYFITLIVQRIGSVYSQLVGWVVNHRGVTASCSFNSTLQVHPCIKREVLRTGQRMCIARCSGTPCGLSAWFTCVNVIGFNMRIIHYALL